MTVSRHAGLALLLVLASLLTGCATTRIDAQWTNPAFAGRPVQGPVLVVGLTRDTTLRRLYEDALAVQLGQRGLTALKSYDGLFDSVDDTSSEPLLQAARTAGAAAVLSTRVIGHEQRVWVDPMPAWGYPGWYGYPWPYAYYPYPGPVSTYERYIASTSLTDVNSGKEVWTARSSTNLPGKVDREVQALAQEIVAGLGKAGLLSGGQAGTR